MEAKIHDPEGKGTRKIKLAPEIFDVPWNGDLVHQVLVSLQANARLHVAHAKDRSEVRGGGKKPWRQKGTGRARHGSSRSPIWSGGGVTHGPTKEENFKKKINQKMKTKALFTALSAKLRDEEVIFVDELAFKTPKTSEAKKVATAFGKVLGNNALLTKKNGMKIFTFDCDENVQKSFRNFKNVHIADVKDMNLLSVLSHKYVILTNPKEITAFLERKLGTVKKESATEKKSQKKEKVTV